jgi:FAD/FMN-containing dehydrogenase
LGEEDEAMSTGDFVYDSLSRIVGEDFVSNSAEELYLYSHDLGAQPPRKVDYVAMPRTVEQVQDTVRLANEARVPITPMGGGLTLSALALPVRGGIVLDMKRMDRIIEVNARSKYAIVEAGVTQGALKSYLEKHHPDLQHSTPESPPAATIVGNVVIHGHGHLTPAHGTNSRMVNGLEVVLPTGEVCLVGSCAVSPHWFTRECLPDLVGLFVGWYGTTGVITKASIQLLPKPKFRDLVLLSTDDPGLLSDVVFELFQMDIAENFFAIAQDKPAWMYGHTYITVTVAGQSRDEFECKKAQLISMFDGRLDLAEQIPPSLKERYLEVPPFAAAQADFAKGGGFEYYGGIVPVEKVPEAWKRGLAIARKHDVVFSYGLQALDAGHSVMCGPVYSFNRADRHDVEKVRQALDESNRLVLELGGLIWKAGLPGQALMMERMDRNTLALIGRIREVLDPNGIMNPGNWGN